MRWVRLVALIGDKRNTCRCLVEKHGDWDRLEDLGMDRKIILKRILKWVEGRGLFYIAEGRNTVMNLQVRKMQEIF
jgi:hypothetical protein